LHGDWRLRQDRAAEHRHNWDWMASQADSDRIISWPLKRRPDWWNCMS